MEIELQALMDTMNRHPPPTLRNQHASTDALGEDAARLRYLLASYISNHKNDPELRDFIMGGTMASGWESVSPNPMKWNSDVPIRLSGGAMHPMLPSHLLASLQHAPPSESSQPQRQQQPRSASTRRNSQTAYSNFLLTSLPTSTCSHDQRWMESTNSLHAHDIADPGGGLELLPSTLTDSSNNHPSHGRSVISIGDRGPLDTLSTLLMMSEGQPAGGDSVGLDSGHARSGRHLNQGSTGNDSTWMLGSRGSAGKQAGELSRLRTGQYSNLTGQGSNLTGQYSNLTASGSYAASAHAAVATVAVAAASQVGEQPVSLPAEMPNEDCDWRTYGGRRLSQDAPTSGELSFMGGGDICVDASGGDRPDEVQSSGTYNEEDDVDPYDEAALSSSSGARLATMHSGGTYHEDEDDDHGYRSDGAAAGSMNRAPDYRWPRTCVSATAAQQSAQGGQASDSNELRQGRRPPVKKTSSLGMLARVMNSHNMISRKSIVDFDETVEEAAWQDQSQLQQPEEGRQTQPVPNSGMPDTRMPSGCRLVMMGADGLLVQVEAATGARDYLGMTQPGVSTGPARQPAYPQLGPRLTASRWLVSVDAAGQLVSVAGTGAPMSFLQPYADHGGRFGGAGSGFPSTIQWPVNAGYGLVGANGSMVWQSASPWSTCHAMLAGVVAVTFLVNASVLMYFLLVRSWMGEMQQWALAGVRQ